MYWTIRYKVDSIHRQRHWKKCRYCEFLFLKFIFCIIKVKYSLPSSNPRPFKGNDREIFLLMEGFFLLLFHSDVFFLHHRFDSHCLENCFCIGSPDGSPKRTKNAGTAFLPSQINHAVMIAKSLGGNS